MSETTKSCALKVDIRGLPILSGVLLRSDSKVFCSLHTTQDFVRFAKQLRGQFCIVVEDGPRITAITDFGCSRPIFYWQRPDLTGYRVSSRLADLIPFSRKQISKEALFFYASASRGGVGIVPFYSDIQEVLPGTVNCFEGARFESLPYVDWQDCLEVRPIAPDKAEERFIEIASEYLGAIARERGLIGCLLSGGTDSALVAWLLKSLGANGPCLTADFAWKRYSEFASAADTATTLGLQHERVLVSAATRQRAFYALNSTRQNAPCNYAQSPVLYQLAQRAAELGIFTLATGDHADALFLGFDHFFSAFPRDTEVYSRAVAALDGSGKLAHLYSRPNSSPEHDDILTAFGCGEKERRGWEEKIYANDRLLMSNWVDRAPLPTLQQLNGQIWAGISWQNSFLPITQAFDERVEFISPFYDIEMIKFAISLPLEYKVRNGTTKVLLRDMVTRLLGRTISKRASPNPSRIWRLGPSLGERRLQLPALRPIYDRLLWRNILASGKLWRDLDKVAALGVWLSGQPLNCFPE